MKAPLGIWLIVTAALLAACGPTPTDRPASATPAPSPVVASPSPSPWPSASVEAEVSCVSDQRASLPTGLGDPCPDAIVAVRRAVESFGFTITRIDVRPGPLDCGVIWPGAQSQAICFGAFVIPGRAMSAWVGFAETSKVAVVGLFRDFPFASAPPSGSIWTATLLAYEVPPTAWTWP